VRFKKNSPHFARFCDNLAWRIAEDHRNKDVMVVFHTADDSLYERHARILGSRFCLPSELFETPKFYLDHPEKAREKGVEDFERVLSMARQWLKRLFEEERLIVADINGIAPTFPALGRYVTDIRKRFPDKNIVVMEDNFHLLEMPGFGKDAGEAKIAAASHFMKQLCTGQQVTVLATMELPKSALERGKRPYYTNVKGTGAIPYDVNANWGVHNDMADMGDDAQIFWEDIEHQQLVQTAGIDAMENTRMPILEVIVDKNKISGFKGTLFFRMWPLSGRIEECSREDQSNFRVRFLDQARRRAGHARGLEEKVAHDNRISFAGAVEASASFKDATSQSAICDQSKETPTCIRGL
jgi:hypothetical protein